MSGFVLPAIIVAQSSFYLKVYDSDGQRTCDSLRINLNGIDNNYYTDHQGEIAITGISPGPYRVNIFPTSDEEPVTFTATIIPDILSVYKYDLASHTAVCKTGHYPGIIHVIHSQAIRNSAVSTTSSLIGLSGPAISVQTERNVYTYNQGYFPTREQTIQGFDNIHIRGGEEYDTGLMFDDMMLNDPFTGSSFHEIPSHALGAVIVFPAPLSLKYSSSNNGIIILNPMPISDSWKFSGELKSDAPAPAAFTNGFGHHQLSFSASGTILPRLGLFMAGDYRHHDDAEPSAIALPAFSFSGSGIRYADPSVTDTVILRNKTQYGSRPGGVNSDERFSMYTRLSYKPHPRWQTDFSSLLTSINRNIFQQSYLFTPGHVPHYERFSGIYSLRVLTSVDDDKHIQWNLSYNHTQSKIADRSWFNRIDNRLELMNGLDSGIIDQTMKPMFMGINAPYRQFQKSFSGFFQSSANFTWHVNQNSQLKAGLQGRMHTIRYLQLWGGEQVDHPSNVDGYGYSVAEKNGHIKIIHNNHGPDGAKHPFTYGAFGEGLMIENNFIIQAGVRWDYWNSGQDRLRKIIVLPVDDSDYTTPYHKDKISYAVGIETYVLRPLVFFANHHRNYQMLPYQGYYLNSGMFNAWLSGDHVPQIGNPYLRLQKTLHYEIGLKLDGSDRWQMSLTKYWSDQKYFLGKTIIDPYQSAGVLPVIMYANMYMRTNNSEDVDQSHNLFDGMEFKGTFVLNGNMTLHVNGNISDVKEIHVSQTSGFHAAWLNYHPVNPANPAYFNRKYNGVVHLLYESCKREGFRIFNSYPMENSSVSVVFKANSGLRYTRVTYDPININGYDGLNSRILSRRNEMKTNAVYSWDMKYSKIFIIQDKYQVRFYVTVINLINARNPVMVYPTNGSAQDDGFLDSIIGRAYVMTYGPDFERFYKARIKDGLMYDTPRQVFLGTQVSF